MLINEKLMLVIDLLNKLQIELKSTVPQGITNQIDMLQPQLVNWLQEAVYHVEETGDSGVDDGFKYCKIEAQSKKPTRKQFMDYFRSEAFDNELSANDCVEVFHGSLKGQSDITHKLLDQLCGNYDSSLEGQLFESGFVIKSLHPLNEVRLLVYKGYECPVIHESAKDELDEQALFVCSDEEWAMSDAELIAKLVEDDVIHESEDELTLAQAVKVVLNNYKDVSSNDDWAKAMAAMQEWSDGEKGLMTEPL